MSHSPVNTAQLTLTFGEVITSSRYSTIREAFIPHPTNPDIHLQIQVIAYGEELAKTLLDADHQIYFASGELHQSKVDMTTVWTLYPQLLFPYGGSTPINIIKITGRFGGKHRKSGYSTSADKAYVRDALALPCHHTKRDNTNPKSPSNRTWIYIVAYEDTATLLEKYTQSGHLCSITGSLVFRVKNDMTYSDVEVHRIEFLASPHKKPELDQPELLTSEESPVE